jgi:hypothetical protein
LFSVLRNPATSWSDASLVIFAAARGQMANCR